MRPQNTALCRLRETRRCRALAAPSVGNQFPPEAPHALRGGS